MGSPRITYNSINLDFPEALTDLVASRFRTALKGTSHGGVTETVRMGEWDEIEIRLDRFSDRAFWRSLHAWYAWASRGKQFSFTLDSAKVHSTTLAGPEAAGQTIITLSGIGTFATSDEFIIESSDRTKRERHTITVAAAPSGDDIQISSPGLLYGYAAGDVVRHADYWPKLVLSDDRSPFRELPSMLYTVAIHAMEDRG